MPVDTSIFDNIKGAATPTLNVEDIKNSPSYALSPAEQEMFQRQQSSVPTSTGALNPTDYYPTLHSPINVGNYSGSVIGSTSLFAPEGALVPIGMMDARDAAIQKAALQKAMDVQDFRDKLSANAPETELASIREGLTNNYFNHLDYSWNKALKDNGGDPNKAAYALQHNMDFQRKTQAYHDTAKFGGDIVHHIADIQKRKANGEVVSAKEEKLSEDILTGLYDHNSAEFKAMGHNILGMKAEKELGATVNNIAKDIQRQKDAAAGINVNSEDYRIRETTDMYYTPEEQQSILDAVRKIYPNSRIYSDSDIKDYVMKTTSAHQKTANVSVQQKHDGGEGKQVDYSPVQPLTETEQNIKSPSGTLESKYAQTVYKTLGKDEKMVLRIPISKSMREANKELDEASLSGKAGYIQGTVSQIQNMPYDVSKSEYLSAEEVKNLKEKGEYYGNKNIRLKPRGVINLDRPEAQKGDVGSQNTVYVDVDEFKGKFTNKSKQKGQHDFDDKINELKKEAEQFNSESDKKTQSKNTGSKMITVTLNGRQGQIPENSWEAFKKKYPSATK